jgi:putative tryptophan/tyrosine transport system substrate-binding protein
MILRREFIAGLGSAAAWPVVTRAQQRAPVISVVYGGSAEETIERVRAFRTALGEAGYVDGQNVRVEYHWLEGRYDRLSVLTADLVRRHVALIAMPANTPGAIAAKAATTTIPIVFGVSQDPVKLGLVASLARPGGNATGINFFTNEVITKRLGLLKKLVPNSVRIAVLLDPANASSADSTLRDAQEAASALGLQIRAYNASTSEEINSAFAMLARERPDALFVAPEAFFVTRRVQLANLAARERIPSSYGSRGIVVAGGLMSYGIDSMETWRQVGAYAGQILKGVKPADLPVVQSTKFEFVLNLQTAKLLGIDVPPDVLAIADEVLE